MGKLQNPKWERYAQAVVAGASEEDAVAAAIPAVDRRSGRFRDWLPGVMGQEEAKVAIERRIEELGGKRKAKPKPKPEAVEEDVEGDVDEPAPKKSSRAGKVK